MNKSIFRQLSCVVFTVFLLVQLPFAQDTLPSKDKEIIGWLQANAVPIRYVEAGSGFSDLHPFRKVLKDVKVLGLGETTHGTREFFQFKHRLLEFLVEHMGFNVFTLEASYAGCQRINDYVLYGKGDLTTVLSAQGFVLWDTAEMADLIRWMRRYNQRISPDKKIRFYGLDLWYNEFGRVSVIEYLEKHGPSKVADTKALFTLLAKEEEKWPVRIDEIETKVKDLLPRVTGLISYLSGNEARLVSASSPAEFKQILKYVQVMQQWLISTINDPLSQPKNSVRSKFKAENLLYLMQEMPDSKFVAWEHNDHIGIGYPETGVRNMGSVLRDKLGDAYYAMGFEFNQGYYQSRVLLPDKTVGRLKIDTVPAAPEKSLSWYLSRGNRGNHFLNLRVHPHSVIIEEWLTHPQIVRKIPWIHQEDARKNFEKMNIKSRYDGILFIDKTTSVRPTANAIDAAFKKQKF